MNRTDTASVPRGRECACACAAMGRLHIGTPVVRPTVICVGLSLSHLEIISR